MSQSLLNLKLKEKCAIVTGGTRNLGRSIVLALLKEGMKVVTSYRHDDHSAQKFLREVSFKFRPNIRVHKLDISIDSSCRELCSIAIREFGRLDVLVNNAAVIISQAHNEISDNDFDIVFQNTLRSTIYMTRAAFSIMKESGGGRIVNMSSAGVYTANPNELLYLCAKAGVEGATRAFARLGAKYRITVNAIAAHVISSGMGRSTLSRDPTILQRIPLGRTGGINEFVNLVLFLSSQCCEYMTGQDRCCILMVGD